MESWIAIDGDDVLLRIKAVPGASGDAIAGVVGDRLKVRVSAAPEGGKANQAICRVIARGLGIRSGQVTVDRGQTHPEKTLRVAGIDFEQAATLRRN